MTEYLFFSIVTIVTKERNMKRIIISIVIFVMISSALLIGKNIQSKPEAVKIGISKLMAHPALDSIEKGIKDYLLENGIDADVETQNANGDISTAVSIAQLFNTEKKDLVVGIATPTAQALANTFEDIPVVFATVTDPESAGLSGLENVAGTSDMVPVEEHLKIIEEVTGAERIGMIYTSGEANGITLMETMKEACEKNGVELITASVSNSSEVKMAAESIIDRVDAMYEATDNTVISAIAAVSEVCMDNSVPLFSADVTSSFDTDVLIAGGFDYYASGKLTGEVIRRMLNGEEAKDIGTLYLEDLEILVNLDVATRLGIQIPDDIMQRARYVIENGETNEL